MKPSDSPQAASSALASRRRGDARGRLLDVALREFRQQGYAATSVDDLCRSAGVTKGAFFHHFESKDALAVAAARHWTAVTAPMFAAADYHAVPVALPRVLAYLDFRLALASGTLPEITCLAGTLVQEVYATHPAIRDACRDAIVDHAATLVPDFSAAIHEAGKAGQLDPADLALHTQVVLQGAFVLAKSVGDTRPIASAIGHLKDYFQRVLSPVQG